MPETPAPEQEGSAQQEPPNHSSNGSGPSTANESSNAQAQSGQTSNYSSGAKSSSGAQIRSRITVVCGECKRLKLKCDRRQPCNSCIKRDITAKCIYSVAAAEKIDVQSLHNRLLTVEGQITQLTSAQQTGSSNVSGFKPPYPLATAQSASAGTSHPSQSSRPSYGSALGGLPCNNRSLLVTAASGSSVVVSLEDTAGIWLPELDSELSALSLSDTGSSASASHSATKTNNAANPASRVKLEPTPVVLPPAPSSRPSTSPSAASTASNASPSPQQASGLVAPLPHSVFLLGPGAAFSLAGTPSGSSQSPVVPEYPTSSTPQGDVPQVTPALLSYLPTSAAIRARFLKGLADTMALHPSFNVRHFEQRVDAMILWGEAHAEAVKSKASLAREIFGAAPATSKKSAPVLERTTPKPTLSFFSAACGAFALGALVTRDNGEPSSLNSADPDTVQRNSPQALFAISEQTLSVFEKTNSYDVDSVIAMLLQVLYLLHDGQMRVAHTTFPLVGKMVNVARMMGLAIDPDEFSGTYTLFEAERRRRIWWDVVYYDTVVSDCMGQQPLIAEDSYNTRMPADTDEEKFCPSSTAILAPENDDVSGRFSYFILKCKLAQLVKGIRRQIATSENTDEPRSGLLDKAAAHETEIKTWLSELPTAYRLNMELDLSQPLPEDVSANTTLIAQRCGLVIIANRLVLKLYLPFLRDTGDGGNATKSAHQAVLGTITAAHAIIYACGLLHSIWADNRPTAFDYYDYGRSLFDAAVACAQAVAQQPSNLLVSQGTKTISSALDILRNIHASKSNADASSIASEAIKIVEMMQGKADRARASSLSEAAATGSKRKRLDVESAYSSGLLAGFQLPFVGPSVSSVKPAKPRPSVSMAKIARRDSGDSRPSKSSKDKGKAAKLPTVGIRIRDPQPQPSPTVRPSSCNMVVPSMPPVDPPATMPQSRMSEAPGSVSTPTSDGSAGYSYPNPPPPLRPPPIETMQHDFQMEYSGTGSASTSSSRRYPAPYADTSSYTSSTYDSRQSPYTPVQPHLPSDAFRSAPPAQEYSVSPPYPAPTPTYQQNNMDMTMSSYPPSMRPTIPSASSMNSPVTGTQRESRAFVLPPERAPSMYEHSMTKTEMALDFQHAHAHTHSLPPTATSHVQQNYAVQSWPTPDMSRSGPMWDPYYSQPPPPL